MLREREDDFDFKLEQLVLGLTEQIAKAMHEEGITRADLARRLNVNPAAITRILRGDSSFRLRTLLAIADALGRRLKVDLVGSRMKTEEGKHGDF